MYLQQLTPFGTNIACLEAKQEALRSLWKGFLGGQEVV